MQPQNAKIAQLVEYDLAPKEWIMFPTLAREKGRRNKNTAKIAQLVEHDLAKVGVAGSSPVFRSKSMDARMVEW